jgi:hypothetical protein
MSKNEIAALLKAASMAASVNIGGYLVYKIGNQKVSVTSPAGGTRHFSNFDAYNYLVQKTAKKQ